MSQFFSKYQGGGPSAVPPGFMQAAAQSGQSIAAGIEKFGEGIANYRKNRREKRQAEAIFEDLYANDPIAAEYSVDQKRLNKLKDGKGTTEDYLAAANSIKSRIEEAKEIEKAEEDARRFDVQQAGIMERFAQSENRAERTLEHTINKYEDALDTEKADLTATRIMYEQSSVPDMTLYEKALEKTRQPHPPHLKKVAMGEEMKLRNMSLDEIEAAFTRKESPLEKAGRALNVEGISPDQIERIMRFANEKSDTELVFQEDPKTGRRYAVSPKTGAFKGSDELTGNSERQLDRASREKMAAIKRIDSKQKQLSEFRLAKFEAEDKLKDAESTEFDQEEQVRQKNRIKFIDLEIARLKKDLGIEESTESPDTSSPKRRGRWDEGLGRVVFPDED